MDPLVEKNLQNLSREKSNLSLAWNDLSVYKKKIYFKYYRYVTLYKQIIYNGAGVILPGQIVAIMGPSHSGKTALLTSLSCRYSGQTLIKGNIKVNGRYIDENVQTISGFLFKEDSFIKALTVREHLMFTAKLKMSRYAKPEERKKRVEALLEALMLGTIADCFIGGIFLDSEKDVHTLSDGEMRRLSLATAMINLPKIIFAEKPTNNLDSYHALQIIQLLKAVSKHTGAPVLCTITQPMCGIFTLFDKIILLANGHLMFSGTPNESVEFYRNYGFIEEGYMSHPDFIVKCVSFPREDGMAENIKNIKVLSKAFLQSKYFIKHTKKIKAVDILGQGTSGELYLFLFKGPLMIKKICVLLSRNLIVIQRELGKYWFSIMKKIVLALIAGYCVSGLTKNVDQDSVQSIQGVLFLLITENTYVPMYNVINMFPKEYPLFIKEYYNNCYSATTYFIVKSVSNIPGEVIEAIAYTLTLYIMAGLRKSLYALVMTIVTASLCTIISASFGMLLLCVFTDLPTSVTFVAPFDYIMLISAGFFIHLGSIHWSLQWLKYCSWFFYTYEIYTILQWEGVSYIGCRNNNTNYQCFTTGEQVISEYSFKADHFLMDIISLIAIYFVINIFGLIIFNWKINNITWN